MTEFSKALLYKVQKFLKEPYTYEFNQVIWWLRKLNQMRFFQTIENSDESSPTEVHIKAFESIRLRATVRYNAPPTAVDKIEIAKYQGEFQPVVWINFTGIAGIQGPLALVYTEQVFRNTRARDNAAATFLDIFNHRIISLFYSSHSTIPGFAPISPHQSPIGKILLALGGQEASYIPHPELKTYLLTYKHLFWKCVRSAENLRQILSSFFSAEVFVGEFYGQYVPIDPQKLTRIGIRGGEFNTLGRDAFLGDRSWRQDRKIQIMIHDMKLEQYALFNPYTEGMNLLHFIRICRSYVPSTIGFEAYLSVQKGHKKTTILGQQHYLGFDTWLTESEPTPDTLHFIPPPKQWYRPFAA